MTQPDHPARRSPRRRSTSRTDSTHPTPPRPGGRRGGDRRPWPTAPTSTRPSPGKPASDTTRSRSRGSASTPTPATVWTAGAAPIDLDAAWPPALVEKIVSSFSEPGGRVVLLAWPTTNADRPRLAAVGADGVIDHAPGIGQDPELDDALHAVEHLDRTARVERVPVDPNATGPASRPFWTDLIGDSSPAPATIPTAPAAPVDPSPSVGPLAASDSADLIITSLRPEHSGDSSADSSVDLAALFAARLLRVGGILVVLTHCDWTTGELTDPTGAVVTAGQNADLLYLQHIVALHAPVRDGRFHLRDEHPDGNTDDDSADDAKARARHRTEVRGLSAPHRRIHSDVLVFAQPHDHQPPSLALPTGTAEKDGDLR